MTDLTHLIRWNASFVRGLAQSVLERAQAIRTTLTENGKPAPKKRGAGKKSSPAKRAPSRRAKRTDA